jgi:alpha-N-arabinofuranosidase
LVASAWATQPVSVKIDATRPGAVINKNLYGQAVDAHGSSLWVGPESRIANIKGWRKDGVAALKDLHLPLVRWPGACSADEYNWRDGLGPRDKRPVKWRPDRDGGLDDNAVGTHEIFDLIESTGADAYVVGNVGTGSPREAAEWVEYMVADGESSLARLRARNGRARPYKLAYFGVGHAPWGCGGNMSPQYYADLYNQYAVFIRGKADKPPKLVAGSGSPDWTDELSTKKRIRDYRDGISAHYDTAFNGQGESQGTSAASGEAQWISTMKWALDLNTFIASHLTELNKNDPAKKMSLVIGAWGTRDGRRREQNALGDALVAALHFHIFHRHAERMSMANFDPTATAGHAMFLTEGKQMALTPTYHAFRMHVPFQDAKALPVTLDRNLQYALGGVGIPALSASAARGSDGKLYLSVVNANPKEAVAVAVEIAGAAAQGASGSVLTARTMNAYNSLAEPQAVRPAPVQAQAKHGKLLITLEPKSVTVLAIEEASP